MKRKKDSSSIVYGYKCNPNFQKEQISKVLNLDSYYSYVSVNLSHPDGFVLIDRVTPYAIQQLSKVFPFVIIRSSSIKCVEIVFVTENSIFDISTKLYCIRSYIKYYFPEANLI